MENLPIGQIIFGFNGFSPLQRCFGSRSDTSVFIGHNEAISEGDRRMDF